MGDRSESRRPPSRRSVLAAAAAATLSGAAPPVARAQSRKVKLGVVGCGGRGAWIAQLFLRHGGYEIAAVADYFQDAADACGNAVGTPAGRRFSGLGGYRRLMDSGVEAVALETPPFFFPEHAVAAAEAGLHVFMAKPVAVDAWGCRVVEEAAARLTRAGRVFLVDYQMPTDPGNAEVVRRVRAGEIGKVVMLNSHYFGGQFNDPPLGRTIENRLRNLVWVNDTALGGGYHGNACIHAVHAAMWVAGATPVAAMGVSTRGRPSPHGDTHDLYSITFEYAGGLLHNHRARHLNDRLTGFDFCASLVHGHGGFANVAYSGTATLLTDTDAVREEVANLYEAGAIRNIATFHKAVLAGDATNDTVRAAVDSCVATIAARDACLRRTRLTLAQVRRENRRLRVDLRGLRD
ncbi:MAG TPA: Gfo/Idh/MocA family oxidoreductase [Chthonomonadales bacterium]|nr:Gfo/Idh/MocA family oxidoreductase [Chthonomonadales bacterium]